MSFLDGLNPEQRAAVTLPRVSALILAGAGSGKTRVLTTRIAWLIHCGLASPHGILAVTFTNKAAREMLARVSAMLPLDPRGMWIGTFHGLAHRLLRIHHRDAGLPREFQILDSADQLSLLKRVMKNLNVDDEKFPPRQVAYYINASKEAGLRASKIEPSDFVSRRMNEIYAAYDEQCIREGAVDFAELLLRSYELLVENESLREHYRRRFGYILVDEFQDTNLLQYQWLKLIAGLGPSPAAEANAVFAVGDDDQSIYAFRGANVGNMQDFTRDFAVEHVVKLEQNYRSEANILDAANALISHNRGRLGKNLWTATPGNEPLKLMQAMNDLEEADYVVAQVQDLSERGIGLNEIAVFYRSNAQSRVLEHALFRAAIPYRVYGGLRFFERQEIKHALSYLRLVANADDDGAFLRVVNFPARGIGIRTLDHLTEFARHRNTSLWGAAVARAGVRGREHPSSLMPYPTSLSHAPRGVEGFVGLIESMRQGCTGVPLPEAIEHVIELSGLKGYYENERDGKDRVANLDELVSAAQGFVQEQSELSPENMLAEFLAHAALEAGEYQAEAGVDALQMMTVHAAKGLEFHSVFITGLEEGLFPHENSLNDPGGIEEERRLMYVALTRGRKRVYLSFAQSRLLHGHTRYNIASRFIREIPEKLIARNAPYTYNRWVEPARGQTSATAEADAPSAWKLGQAVVHSKFGYGVIVNMEGRGLDARVQVNFRDAGVKWLALEYAKLTKA
jgi:DNA helicase-2/ATP-dependent DNA helicase PcrA